MALPVFFRDYLGFLGGLWGKSGCFQWSYATFRDSWKTFWVHEKGLTALTEFLGLLGEIWGVLRDIGCSSPFVVGVLKRLLKVLCEFQDCSQFCGSAWKSSWELLMISYRYTMDSSVSLRVHQRSWRVFCSLLMGFRVKVTFWGFWWGAKSLWDVSSLSWEFLHFFKEFPWSLRISRS